MVLLWHFCGNYIRLLFTYYSSKLLTFNQAAGSLCLMINTLLCLLERHQVCLEGVKLTTVKQCCSKYLNIFSSTSEAK